MNALSRCNAKFRHHFIKGIAGGRAKRAEHPSTFGGTKTSKTYFVDPNKHVG